MFYKIEIGLSIYITIGYFKTRYKFVVKPYPRLENRRRISNFAFPLIDLLLLRKGVNVQLCSVSATAAWYQIFLFFFEYLMDDFTP